MKLAANLSLMFADVPFLHRFEAAAKAGFKRVEFLFPYEFDTADIRARLDDNGLELVLFNISPGDWAAGERGLTALASRQDDFATALAQALDTCVKLGCRQLHAMAGLAQHGADEQAYRANLASAAQAASECGVTVLIEPINSTDMPGYHLSDLTAAMDTIAAVDEPALKLQFDVYHRAMMGGDVLAELRQVASHIRHVQIAGCPGRNEPDTGTFDYAPVFSTLESIGYDGAIGCEYRPKGDTAAVLGWRDKFPTRLR